MYGIEKKLFDQLLLLKDKYGLMGIKAEFEAEGSSFRDIMRLRRLTSKGNVALHIKIGGVEAVRDIKDSLELGVDGIIAPMVETSFGLKKFLEAYGAIYKDHRIHLSINVETRNAFEELDSIMELARGQIDSVTLGRTDMSASYFDPAVIPDSDFLLDLVKQVGQKVRKYGLGFTVGGSISVATADKLRHDPSITENIARLETRKVILPTDAVIKDDKAIREALKFEELYILSKKEFSDLFIESEVARLMKLTRRQ